jgi:hypothetical protein
MKKHPPGWKKYVASRLPGQKLVCFACHSDYCIESDPRAAVTADGKVVYVGRRCYEDITEETGLLVISSGWGAVYGRPRIYKGKFAKNGDLISIVAKDREVFRAQKRLEQYRNYNHSPKGRTRSRKYRESPGVRFRKNMWQRDYQQRPEVRDQRKWTQRSRRTARRIQELKWTKG